MKHNIFTEETNKIALSSNDDKRIQSIVLTETNACRMTIDLVCKREELNVIK